MKILPKTLAVIVGAALLAAGPAFAGVEEDIAKLQREWERVKYQTAPASQEKEFERLAADAGLAVSRHPDRAEPLIWHGIIVASHAGAKGGLGALSLAKDAKRDFEQALQVNSAALAGSAYTSLGSLYYQVPGWPPGFGDDKKALEFLQRGLAVNPDGIDPNFFHGDFLFRTGDLDNAERALRKVLQAPPRAGRKLADEGRRREISQLLEKIAEKRRLAPG